MDICPSNLAGDQGMPQVSVIIAVFNGSSTRGAQLAALESQIGAPSFEVLVMDNNSSDDVRNVVSRYPALNATVVPATRRQGQCYARNLGVLTARGQHILICDQDDVVAPGWVRALHEELSQRAALATGPIDVALLNSPEVARAYSAGSGTELLRPMPCRDTSRSSTVATSASAATTTSGFVGWTTPTAEETKTPTSHGGPKRQVSLYCASRKPSCTTG